MCALLDPNSRQWIDIVAECFTAIGTVSAVIVALWLSRKDRKERIAVSAAITHLVTPGVRQTISQGQRVFTLTATNFGFANVSVMKLCARVGLLRRRVLDLVILPGKFQTETAPKELAHGQWLRVNVILEEYIGEQRLFYLMEEIRKHPIPCLALRSLRLGVETSTGKRFFGRPNWELRNVHGEQFEKFKQSQSK
jgi:hypothetical protein